MDNKDLIVFNLSIANDMIERGFKILRILPNRDIHGKVVCYFERDKELIDVLKNEYRINVR